MILCHKRLIWLRFQNLYRKNLLNKIIGTFPLCDNKLSIRLHYPQGFFYDFFRKFFFRLVAAQIEQLYHKVDYISLGSAAEAKETSFVQLQACIISKTRQIASGKCHCCNRKSIGVVPFAGIGGIPG